jgi:ribosome-associated protein
MIEVNITTNMIKLDQFLKWAGIAENGSMAKQMVLDGIVKVNGEIVLQRGKKLYKGYKILIDEIGEFIIV